MNIGVHVKTFFIQGSIHGPLQNICKAGRKEAGDQGPFTYLVETVQSRDKGKNRNLAKRAWISLIQHDGPWAFCCLKSSVSKRGVGEIASG